MSIAIFSNGCSDDCVPSLLYSISKIGEVNDKPIFIKDVVFNRKKYEVSILYNFSTKSIVDKIINLL